MSLRNLVLSLDGQLDYVGIISFGLRTECGFKLAHLRL